jgi:hypothetical protein
MPLLARLKERLLGETRVEQAMEDMEKLYDRAEDPEAFHAALADGDIDRAANHSSLSHAEIESRLDSLYTAGVDLAEEYPEVADTEKEEFADA